MISVCIATYNGGEYLRTQLESILPQLREGDEIIISDDGSTDDTRAICYAMNNPLIRVIDGPALGCPIPNFENALRHARGEYIFLSDQDDRWLPGKVERLLQELQTTDCVNCDCRVTDAHLNVTSPSFNHLIGGRPGRWFNLLVRNAYLGGCMAFRRCVMEKSLPFPKDIPMHDIWIGNVAAFFFRLRFIDDVLSDFRRTGNNVSTSAGKSQNSLGMKILIRWIVVKNLVRKIFR